MSIPVFEIRNVRHVAGETVILDGVSWRVEPGQHWVLLGPNGAGKTTLLRIACGYLWPNAGGQVLRLGEPLLDLRDLRRSIGWVSHRLASEIPPRERVLDTVVSGRVGHVGLKASLHGPQPSSEDYVTARQFLADLDCEPLVDHAFKTLSQGEQQKVLIARARMSLPMLVVLDEPCAGLDPGARERFLISLESLASRQNSLSLILVTHHLEEIVPAFDNLLALKQGKVVGQGLTHEVVSPALIESLYGSPVRELIQQNGRIWPVF